MTTPLPRIARVAPLAPLSLVVQFDDGTIVVADLSAVAARGAVFARLGDERYFKRARVTNGGRAVAWPHGLDFCADALYLDQVPRHKAQTAINSFGARIFAPSAEVIAA